MQYAEVPPVLRGTSGGRPARARGPLSGSPFRRCVRRETTGSGYRYLPIHLSWRVVPLNEIRTVESTGHRPIREFGGWGIRFGRRGRACTVSGTDGLADALTRG